MHAITGPELTVDDQEIDAADGCQTLCIRDVGPGRRNFHTGNPADRPDEQVEQQRVIVDDHTAHAFASRRHGGLLGVCLVAGSTGAHGTSAASAPEEPRCTQQISPRDEGGSASRTVSLELPRPFTSRTDRGG
jgi:hypothetical protein